MIFIELCSPYRSAGGLGGHSDHKVESKRQVQLRIRQGRDPRRLHQRPLPALYLVLYFLRGCGEAGRAARGEAREAAGGIRPRFPGQPRGHLRLPARRGRTWSFSRRGSRPLSRRRSRPQSRRRRPESNHAGRLPSHPCRHSRLPRRHW